MTVDDIKKTFWIYTTYNMYELTINNEERDVWKLYLEKKRYNSALRYCKDPGQKDKVFIAQAKDYFGQRRYKMSAEIFANSTVPFEEVALMFIEKDEVDALRVYLTNKLTCLRKNVCNNVCICRRVLIKFSLGPNTENHGSHMACGIVSSKAQ